jgi:predicted small secreted protein
MRKLIFFFITGVCFTIASCNNAHKTGGAGTDSSATNGYSGTADTAMTNSTGTSAQSTGGSDTSTITSGRDNTSTDSTSSSKP